MGHTPACKSSPDWKIRAGDYRIAYEIRDDQVIVCVVRVLDRKEIYRTPGRMQRPIR